MQLSDRYEFWNSSTDKFVEFGTKNIEILRQPLEDPVLTISKTPRSLPFPSNFILKDAGGNR
jgi:magnesium chelatase family protein